MNKIKELPLWIGNASDLRDLKQLYDQEIQAVLALAAEEPISTFGRDLIYCRIPILDGIGNSSARLKFAIETLIKLLVDNVSTLVVCSAGLSRTPCIAAGAISILSQTAPEECLKTISDHQRLDVSSSLCSDVLKVFSQLDLGKI